MKTLLDRHPGKSLKSNTFHTSCRSDFGGYFIAVGAKLLGTKYAGASTVSLINSMNPVTMTLFGAIIRYCLRRASCLSSSFRRSSPDVCVLSTRIPQKGMRTFSWTIYPSMSASPFRYFYYTLHRRFLRRFYSRLSCRRSSPPRSPDRRSCSSFCQ